jgi:hypothetical protein
MVMKLRVPQNRGIYWLAERLLSFKKEAARWINYEHKRTFSSDVQLTTCSRVCLHMVTSLMKFPTFYGTQRFITVLASPSLLLTLSFSTRTLMKLWHRPLRNKFKTFHCQDILYPNTSGSFNLRILLILWGFINFSSVVMELIRSMFL